LAFRGGTALHKLFVQPAARYSEDIDLVQITEGPIGPILEALRTQLNPWLGEPRWKSKKGRDLFDLVIILKKSPTLEIEKMLQSFHQYMAFDQTKVSRAEFEANLAGKLNDGAFVNDIYPLLPPGFNMADYHPITDAIHVQERIISQLPGDSWKGIIV